MPTPRPTPNWAAEGRRPSIDKNKKAEKNHLAVPGKASSPQWKWRRGSRVSPHRERPGEARDFAREGSRQSQAPSQASNVSAARSRASELDAELQLNARVEVHGLKNATGFNGLVGRVVDNQPTEHGLIWTVLFAPPHGRQQLLADNLKMLSKGESSILMSSYASSCGGSIMKGRQHLNRGRLGVKAARYVRTEVHRRICITIIMALDKGNVRAWGGERQLCESLYSILRYLRKRDRTPTITTFDRKHEVLTQQEDTGDLICEEVDASQIKDHLNKKRSSRRRKKLIRRGSVSSQDTDDTAETGDTGDTSADTSADTSTPTGSVGSDRVQIRFAPETKGEAKPSKALPPKTVQRSLPPAPAASDEKQNSKLGGSSHEPYAPSAPKSADSKLKVTEERKQQALQRVSDSKDGCCQVQ
eukprot:Hpha_TRINITY_DN649_c0_g1::TRINITY_DN649_c0_g1_i1::g.21265::m.21265